MADSSSAFSCGKDNAFNIVSVKDAINSLSSISHSVWRLSEGRWERSLSCRIVCSVGSVLSCVICVMLICFSVPVLRLIWVADNVQWNKFDIIKYYSNVSKASLIFGRNISISQPMFTLTDVLSVNYFTHMAARTSWRGFIS